MGCCKGFRRTWVPGYSADVIDPNKAFDFERRLIIVKKVIVIVLLLALLIGLICLVVYVTGSKNEADVPGSENSKVSSLTAGNGNTLTSASVIPLPTSIIPGNSSTNTPQLFGPPEIIQDNMTSIPETSIHPVMSQDNSSIADSLIPVNNDNSSVVLDSLSSLSNDSVGDTSVISSLLNNNPQSNTNDQKQKSSNLSCSSNGDVLECIALSKSFKTVTTFSNSTSKHNGSVEGYVMVRTQKHTIWHPYCHPHWTLEMGYQLCRGLGFQQLLRLQTIDIYQLKQRMTHRLGKEVSLHSGSPTQPQELLVLTTESSISPVKANASQYNCLVGYIFCNEV